MILGHLHNKNKLAVMKCAPSLAAVVSVTYLSAIQAAIAHCHQMSGAVPCSTICNTLNTVGPSLNSLFKKKKCKALYNRRREDYDVPASPFPITECLVFIENNAMIFIRAAEIND